MLKAGPKPEDVQDLQFKLRCKIQVFNNDNATYFNKNCNLVASAGRLGLLFVGSVDSYFQALLIPHFEELLKEDDGIISKYKRRIIQLPSPPLHLTVNCDHTILAVVFERNGCPWVKTYEVVSILKENIIELGEICLSPTPQVTVKDINWNPAIPSTLTACKSDGTLGIYQILKPGVEINELPAAAGVTSFCWSPKGKQIAVGSANGKITQYKPDLKAVKVIDAPTLPQPHMLISLHWVSNYQFIGIFKNDDPDSQSLLMVIDAPKTGNPIFTSFEDLCYGGLLSRPLQLYTLMINAWNILLVTASNCMEVGVMGIINGNWSQWLVGDAARAELPLTTSHDETLPVGLALETAITQGYQLGEQVFPNFPVLLMLSDHGVLCCFTVLNLRNGIENICIKPEVGAGVALQFFELNEVIPPNQHIQKPEPPVLKDNILLKVPSQPTLVQPQTIVQSPSLIQPPQNQSPQFDLKGGIKPLTQISSNAPTSSPVNNQIKPRSNEVVPNVQKSDPQINPEIAIQKEIKDKAVIREKCLNIESIIASLHQVKKSNINLGTDEEMKKFAQSLQALDKFLKEIVEICSTQGSEIDTLKQSLLQSWAWFEDAKAHQTSTNDASNAMLLKLQPLDASSQKRLEDIRCGNYYLQSQIAQAHRCLDEEWEQFQNYCRKNHVIQMPTMEMIFQTMVKQNTIIQKQKYVLQDIERRIKKKSRSVIGSSLLLTNSEFANEAINQSLGDDTIKKLNYQQVANIPKRFSEAKSNSLRDFLQYRKIPHLKAVKINTTALLPTSPSVTRKQLDLLRQKEEANAPIKKLENFTMTIDKKNQNFESTFATLSNKNTIASSPHSAFASTSITPVTHTPSTVIISNQISSALNTNSAFNFSKTMFTAPNLSSANVTQTPITSKKGEPSVSIFSITSTSSTTLATPLFSTTSKGLFNASSTPTKVSELKTTETETPKQFGLFANTSSSGSIFPTSKLSQASTSLTPTVTFFNSSNTTTTPKSAFNVSLSTSTSSSSPTTSTTVPKTGFATNFKTSTPTTLPSFGGLQITLQTTATTGTTTAASIAYTTAASVISSQSTSIFAPKLSTSQTTTPSLPQTKSSLFKSLPSAITTSSTVFNTQTSLFQPTTSTFTPQFSVALTTTPSVLVSQASVPKSATSVFSSQPTTSLVTTSTSIFASQMSASETTTSTISSQPSITTGTSVYASQAPQSQSATSSIFSSQPSVTSSTSAPVSQTSLPPTTTSIFAPNLSGTSTTSSSVFASPAAASIFSPQASAASTTSSTVFGLPQNKTSIFAPQPSVASTISTSVFASQASLPQITASLFASQPSATSTAASIFASPVASSQSTPSIFASKAAVPQSGASIFASQTPSSTTQANNSIFASQPQTTPSLFAPKSTIAITSQAASAIFSAKPSEPQSSSIFAPKSPDTSTTQTSASIFGPKSTETSMFKQASPFTSSSTFGQSSAFGAVNTNTNSNAISFPSQTTASSFSSGSIFGQPTAAAVTTSSSFFGFKTPSSGSIFGGTSFGGSSAFSTTSQTNSSTTSSFGFGGLSMGSAPTSSGVFGQNTNVFNSPSSTSSEQPKNIFGSAPSTSAPIFGSGTSSTNSIFGSNTTSSNSIFGSNTSSQNSVFGASSAPSGSIFGANPTPTFGSPTPAFGAAPVFGQSASTGSIFGQSSNPSSPNNSANTTAFGASTAFSKPGGFGSAAAFGSPPAFGGSPAPAFGGAATFGSPAAFGGAPTFGGSPAFGSPSKIFGSGSDTSAFGSAASTDTASFGNLANQPTVGFGSLAQQAPNPGQAARAPFSGGSSFSSWR